MHSLPILLAILIGSCETATRTEEKHVRPRGTLASQILTFRSSYQFGPSNRGYNSSGDLDVVTYDLREQKQREILNALYFVCYMGSKMYHFCLKRPGLCRTSDKCIKWHKKWWKPKKKWRCAEYAIEEISLPEYIALLSDSGVLCKSDRPE